MRGKAVMLWKPESVARGGPAAVAARLEAAGVQSVLLRVCDGLKPMAGLEPYFQTLQQLGLRVGAWAHVGLDRPSGRDARPILQACARYEPDFFLVRAAEPGERRRPWAAQFLAQLRSAIDIPLGLSLLPGSGRQSASAWEGLVDGLDFVIPPLVSEASGILEGLIATRQRSAADVPEVPIIAVTTDLLARRRGGKSAADLAALLGAAAEDPFLEGVLMTVDKGAKIGADMWDAFSASEWNPGDRQVPPQPIAWARVKSPEGLWICASPDGDRCGSLAAGELTPIWVVTQTRWAALNQAADQWIFVGDADAVETTLDAVTSRKLRYAGLELYQARVATRRGLNVREGSRGRVLRVLPFNAVVRIYEDRDGWARINPAQPEWVRASFLSRLLA